MNKKISVVISAYNEESNIKDCLESVSWANEIILVNSSSGDNTVKIAQKYTSKIFTRPNNKMLNINKNFGFQKATGDWILNLDADERVSNELRKEILLVINYSRNNFNGFEMPRKNIIFGKWIRHGIWWPDYQIRLFQKNKGKFVCIHVHEKIEIKGEVGQLKNPLLHYNYTSVSQFVRKMNDIYTDNEAENFLKKGNKITWQDAIRMPVNDFLANFFARGSWKDGLHGLVLSIMQAFYAFLLFSKVWEKQKFWEYNNQQFLKQVNEQVEKSFQDYKFWAQRAGLGNLIKKVVGQNIWNYLRSLKQKLS
jgi:glycosyltransferase involved in cell wall biosynthesis